MLPDMRACVALLALGLFAVFGCGGGPDDSKAGDKAITTDASSAEVRIPDDFQAQASTGAMTDAGIVGSIAPGTPIDDPTATGAGACAGRTLQSVIAAVKTLQPSLGDIERIRPNGSTSDGDFIYAYAKVDGGFALVFQRGSGDCPAGCLAHEYWYFDTDDTCSPRQSGYYSAGWSTKNCIAVEGTPLWNEPPAPDPVYVCDADNSRK
jgi:hypothetical protein